MRIAIGSDHGGHAYKELLKPFLKELGHEPEDFGCPSPASVDYADYAIPVAEAVAAGRFERGILICGTGVGVSITANKVRGVRCALCGDPVTAKLTRAHNDSNVLAMGQRIIGEEAMKEIVRVWLETPFEGGRHAVRIGKIARYEEK